jgi:hypothetical protein
VYIGNFPTEKFPVCDKIDLKGNPPADSVYRELKETYQIDIRWILGESQFFESTEEPGVPIVDAIGKGFVKYEDEFCTVQQLGYAPLDEPGGVEKMVFLPPLWVFARSEDDEVA